MKLINIPEELRDYVERLHYEENRYTSLLELVTKEGMTDSEYNSSLEYYSKSSSFILSASY